MAKAIKLLREIFLVFIDPAEYWRVPEIGEYGKN